MTFMTSNMTYTKVVNTITFVSSTVYISFKYLYVHNLPSSQKFKQRDMEITSSQS